MTQNLNNYSTDYYSRDFFAPLELPRPDQLAAICYTVDVPVWNIDYPKTNRSPGRIVSMGAGQGVMEMWLEKLGHEVIAVDPAPGALELYKGKTIYSTWSPELIASAATVIFCESIEHIPLEQTADIFDSAQLGTRFIIVNLPEYHPIIPQPTDGWDHITQVDDFLYNKLVQGKDVKIRRGSHLVMDYAEPVNHRELLIGS